MPGPPLPRNPQRRTFRGLCARSCPSEFHRGEGQAEEPVPPPNQSEPLLGGSEGLHFSELADVLSPLQAANEH